MTFSSPDQLVGEQLEAHYSRLQSSWHTVDAPQYAKLVVPTGNVDSPIHGWFHLKEAYSHQLLPAVIKQTQIETGDALRLIDPFSGAGTTLLSAVDLAMAGITKSIVGRGLEVNPFLHFLASTKLASALNAPSNTLEHLSAVVPLARKVAVGRTDWPVLSTFQNAEYFPPTNVDALVALRTVIDTMDAPDTIRSLARIALAIAVEPASRLRRDGRALRFHQRTTSSPFDAYEVAAKRISADLEQYQLPATFEADVTIDLASATNTWNSVPRGTMDLSMFSPPYPNNIDYTEVYKTELWALGFVDDGDSFRKQRQATLRSHPSVIFERGLAYESDPRTLSILELIAPVLQAIPPDSRYAAQLERLVTGYVDDMLLTLDAAYDSLRPGGHCVYVVGNSVHGREAPLVIASDILLARLAELAGFDVERIAIARWLPRRRTGSAFGRESVVFLRKPE